MVLETFSSISVRFYIVIQDLCMLAYPPQGSRRDISSQQVGVSLLAQRD